MALWRSGVQLPSGPTYAAVVELADTQVSKTCGLHCPCRFDSDQRHQIFKTSMAQIDRKILAYVVGLAIGDGNLSNPNGRATRLRITCDAKYKNLLFRIIRSIQTLLPNNKVSIVRRPKNCVDVSCYSNRWENWLGWKVGNGSKIHQRISVPQWIKKNRIFTIQCPRGLFETDGSIYRDRGYWMINFVTMIPDLASDVLSLVSKIGFKAHFYKTPQNTKLKYTVRVSTDADRFIKTLSLSKD